MWLTFHKANDVAGSQELNYSIQVLWLGKYRVLWEGIKQVPNLTWEEE